MTLRSQHLLRVAVLTGLGLALCGCQSIRNAANLNKESPDEFAVLTKAPLVIPPDYNLLPPKPGAAPTNQNEPTESAEEAMFGADTATIAANIQGNYSPEERYVLAKAGIANADPDIRMHLASDRKDMLAADDSFTNSVLFWKGPKKETDTPVDADAEAKRVKDGAPDQATAAKPPEKKDDSGWFDGWFDWF
jgi:hypothetical protein